MIQVQLVMEDLFLNIVRESEARPGARRVSGTGTQQEAAKDDQTGRNSVLTR